MKTKSNINKLVFDKSSISELQTSDLLDIKAGSTILGGETCTGCCCVQTLKTVLK